MNPILSPDPNLFAGSITTFVCNQATITPSITLSAGAPTPIWTVTETGGAVFTYTTAGFTHNRVTAGDMTVRLLNTQALKTYVAKFECPGDGIKSTWAGLHLELFTKITAIDVNGNALLSGNISSFRLPASLATFAVNITSVSGDISGWVLPALLMNFYVNATSVNGATVFTSAVALRDFRYQNCGLPQATVDAIALAVYTRRAAFTYATPSMNIGGTNAAPSGVYADEDPPVTGKGAIYEIVNDPEVEGFKKWAVIYTA